MNKILVSSAILALTMATQTQDFFEFELYEDDMALTSEESSNPKLEASLLTNTGLFGKIRVGSKKQNLNLDFSTSI